VRREGEQHVLGEVERGEGEHVSAQALEVEDLVGLLQLPSLYRRMVKPGKEAHKCENIVCVRNGRVHVTDRTFFFRAGEGLDLAGLLRLTSLYRRMIKPGKETHT